MAHRADTQHPAPDAHRPAGEITGHLFERHVFVCTGGDYCATIDGDGRGVHSRLKSLVAQAGLKGRVRVNHAGCLDQCGFGPVDPIAAAEPEDLVVTLTASNESCDAARAKEKL